MRKLGLMLSAVAMALLGSAAQAQIKIGQTADFSGPSALIAQHNRDGAKLYFDQINATGGVGGQKIELLTLDDKFDPKSSAANAKTLIDQGVLALFMTSGTAQNEAILPLLAQHKLALVAPTSGALLLHDPVNPYVFNVRAGYHREAERAVGHLRNMGVQSLTVLQSEDKFGNDAAQAALRGLSAAGMRPRAHLKFAPNAAAYQALAQQLAKADMQAVLLVCEADAAAGFVAALRNAGSMAQVVTLSNNASPGFVKQLKEQGRGVIVTQLFPNERSASTELVRQAQEQAKARGLGELSAAHLEGFASAKVLVEGLRRAGKDLNRIGLVKSLESIQRYDLGGLELSFNSKKHSGLDFADIAIIGPDGKFWR